MSNWWRPGKDMPPGTHTSTGQPCDVMPPSNEALRDNQSGLTGCEITDMTADTHLLQNHGRILLSMWQSVLLKQSWWRMKCLKKLKYQKKQRMTQFQRVTVGCMTITQEVINPKRKIENPPNWEEEVFGGWRIDDSREEESNSRENRNVYPSDKGNSGVAAEMENGMEYVRCHHCRESKLTKDELKRHIYSAHPSLFMDEVISTDNDFEESYAENDGQTEELEEMQSAESCNIDSLDCLVQMDMNYENVFSKNSSSVVSPSGILRKNVANEDMCEKSIKNDFLTDKESFLV